MEESAESVRAGVYDGYAPRVPVAEAGPESSGVGNVYSVGGKACSFSCEGGDSCCSVVRGRVYA